MSEIDDIVIAATGAVRLSEVCHWFGLEPQTALKRASAQALPVPAFKGKSKNSPWLVKISDMKRYLSAQYDEHKERFDEVNAG